jgi:hypothetical protein
MTQRIIDVAYRRQARTPWDQPTNYARTLLILALSAAGLGGLDQAVAAGTAVLDCGRVVWPTMVLAGQLDEVLARRFPRTGSAADFHACYLDAGTRLALPAARPQQGRDRGASSYYETVKDGGEWPVCQCVECGAEAFVATTDTAETDPDVANWVCYACGHTCADTDIGQCVDCGIMTYKARDGLTVCGNCVAHALAD